MGLGSWGRHMFKTVVGGKLVNAACNMFLFQYFLSFLW